MSALHLAVSLGWADGVRELLTVVGKNEKDIHPDDQPKNSNSKWPWQEAPIHTACRNGDYNVVRVLVDLHLQDESVINFNIPNLQGNLPLHLAAFAHNFDVLELLLTKSKSCKSTISAKNKHGNTPLHMLLLGKELNENELEIEYCTKLMLQQGAEVDAQNEKNRTPLYLAARANLPRVVETLIEYRANPLISDIGKRTVLHAACSTGSYETLKLLLQSEKIKTNDVISREDADYLTPFHLAVYSSSEECCQLLLENGDHLSNRDNKNRTRCAFLIKNLPSSATFLEKLFDKQFTFSGYGNNEKNFNAKIDFGALLSKSSDSVNDSIIPDLLNDEHNKLLLKHPLVESFIYYKWSKISIFFITYAIVYFMFLVLHSYYIVETYNVGIGWADHSNSLRAVHWLQTSILILCLVFTFFSILAIDIKKYMMQRETYIKVVGLTFASLVIFSQGTNTFSLEVSSILATTSIFFAWAEFLMVFGHIPFIGNNVLAFTKVSGSILIFLFAFSPLFIAFTLAFSIILKHVDSFNDYLAVFVRTLVMMTGEIEFSDIISSSESKATLIVSQIYIFIFVILITILMINVITALAVGNLPDIVVLGKITRLTKEASYVDSYERLISLFKRFHFAQYISQTIFDCLQRLGALNTKIITIWPNKKHNEEGVVKLPYEIIEGIKMLNLKKSEHTLESLQLCLNNFIFNYQKDIETLESLILNKDEESKKKVGWIKSSFFSRKRKT